MGLQRRTISFAKTHSSRAENGRSKFRRYNTRGWEGGGGNLYERRMGGRTKSFLMFHKKVA